MGNLCGKESKDDNFAGPGRVVGGTTPAGANNNSTSTPAKASLPASAKSKQSYPKVGGPGRTLGDSTAGAGGDDARSAAAKAAEARANKHQSAASAGDLAKRLSAQKKETRAQTLQRAADENRLQREADQASETRRYD